MSLPSRDFQEVAIDDVNAVRSIAVVCPFVMDRPGGGQSVALGLAAAYDRAGFRVRLIAPDERVAFGADTVAGLDIELVGGRLRFGSTRPQLRSAYRPPSCEGGARPLKGSMLCIFMNRLLRSCRLRF